MSKIKRKTLRNSLKRRPTLKQAGRRILIVTEGQTEEAYFKAIQKRWKLHGMVIIKNPDCTDPESLLAYAKKENEVNSILRGHYDDIWLVYDLEKPNATERRRLSEQVKNKVEKGKTYRDFHLAISDPSFEFWYVLHYEQTTKSFTGADEVVRHLKKHWKSYEKGNTSEKEIENILSRTDTAIKNAAWVRAQLDTCQSTAPVTYVDNIWMDGTPSIHESCFSTTDKEP